MQPGLVLAKSGLGRAKLQAKVLDLLLLLLDGLVQQPEPASGQQRAEQPEQDRSADEQAARVGRGRDGGVGLHQQCEGAIVYCGREWQAANTGDADRGGN